MSEHDPAARRYWLLQLVRLFGLALTMAGAAIVAGKLDAPGVLGAVLFAGGALGFFFLPVMLARRWKGGAP